MKYKPFGGVECEQLLNWDNDAVVGYKFVIYFGIASLFLVEWNLQIVKWW